MSQIRELLRKLDAFQEAKEITIQALERQVKVRTVSKGSHLFYDKDEVVSVYGILNGCVALYKTNSLGEKKVIFIFKEGVLLNEVILHDTSASINCEVLEESQVLVIPRASLLQAMEHDFGVNQKIIASMGMKIRRLYRQLKNTTNSMKGEKKIASKLWKLARDYGKPGSEGVYIDMDMSITYLADMLGSKRETVSRQLKILTEKNLIKVEKNRFVIVDSNKLKEFYEKDL